MEQPATQKQGAVIGGWVCLALGAALMVWSLLSFVLYLPLFLASFILGIVAVAQRRLWHGIPILLLSIVIPLALGMGLGAYRTQQALDSASKAATQRESLRKPDEPAAAGAPETTKPSGPSPEQAYIAESLELYDFEAKHMEAVLDGRIPGVTFKIKNKGDKVLEQVTVVVFFKDASGAIIAEEEYNPVLVSPYSFSSDNKPLKPGYIWQQERGRFYTAKSVPTEWKEGAAEAKITEIRFESKDS